MIRLLGLWCLLPLATLAADVPWTGAEVHFPARTFDVRNFGANPAESKWFYDTVPIQKAIDACAQAGGGTVVIPKGNWLIGPLYLRSHVRLDIQRGAEVAATTEDSVFRKTAANAAWAANSYVATFNIADAEDVAIVGEGRIDGQGAVWWEKWRKTIRDTGHRPGADRPRLIYITRSRNVLISGVSLYNSPSYHVVFKDCDHVTVEGVKIVAPAHSPNTDAIDPIDTRNVIIRDNLVDCGDDVVAVKSAHVDPAHPDAASANIWVTHNRVLKGRGISIGSETIGGVQHVLVEDNTIQDSMYGIRIKTPRPRGGDVSDIVFRNIRMTGVETPIVMSAYYEPVPEDKAALSAALASGAFVLGDQIYPNEREATRPVVPHHTPVIHDITIEDITATGADRSGLIIGLPESPIRHLVLRHVRIEAPTPLLVRNAQVIRE